MASIVDSINFLSAYILHPLSAVETFFPHSRIVLWLSGRAKFVATHDIPDVSGRVFVVTGGNAGLGEESIYQLASHQPAKIFLAARSKEKAGYALQRIRKRLASSSHDAAHATEIDFVHLDLMDLDSVKIAAESISAKSDRLDCLMLNAGVMATPKGTKTAAGHEIQLGTNHIGHFLLTKLLLPLLLRTAQDHPESGARVVSVASEAYNMAPRDCVETITTSHATLCESRPYERYGISKAANILFAAELARRFGPQGITSIAVHPGIIFTDLYAAMKKGSPWLGQTMSYASTFFMDDVPHGALNQLWAAAGKLNSMFVNGAYYVPVGRLSANFWTQNLTAAETLWTWSEAEMERLGY